MNIASGLQTAAQTTTALSQSAAALAQAAGPALNTLKLAMANLQRQQGATYGGDDSDDGFFGGNDGADPAKGLREYEASLSAKAKEDVIRRLARALKRAGINVDPEGDLDEIVKQLVAQIPNPKKGKTFSDDAKAQEKVCRVVADVLNDEFTPGVTKPSEKLIDTSLSAVEICRSVGEWAHSFAAGVNTEFLAVHASVRNTLRQITVLDQIMQEIYNKIKNRVDRGGDDDLGRDIDPLNEVYQRAQNERRRQEMVLQNILNVQLAPAAKELEIAMRDESEQNALIKKLGLKPGTSEFADSLAMAISGLGTAASVAQRVHRALKQVGVTVRQYLDSAEYADFRRVLDGMIEGGKVKTDDLAKFLEAMETLRLSFGERQDPRFREALEAVDKTGGRGRRHGGADEEMSSIGRRVEREKTEKKVIIRDFAGRMARHYDELLAAVKAMGPKLGKEIPLTDKTDALRDSLARLSDMRAQSQRLELALIGRYVDADARERKERFVSALRVVSNSCAALMELEMYRPASAHFARLKAAIDSIEKTIDYYADVITKKFGGQIDDDDEADIYEGGARRGGADDDVALPEISRSALSLNEAVSEFAYFYYVARVRANLEQTSKELDSYGEKYTELLGDAVAARLYSLEKQRTAILARLVPGAALNNAALAAVKKWVNDEYDIKARFYRALQAMDLYMKAFTAAIVKDPDAVRDIKKMLDGTQVIARWFSEKTGDFIWKAFEQMSATDFGGNVVPAAAGTAVSDDAANANREHYYDRVGAAAADTLGVPELGVRPTGDAADHATAAKKAVGDALDYYQALKNLVNAFARIGDKFGGRELRTQVFMSPAQIYKTLIDYLKQSALSINAGSEANPPADLDMPLVGTIARVGAAVPPYNVYFGSVLSGVAGNYVVENRYFALVIKAMGAKILTALGVYDMFERTSPLYDLTPTRMIIGGAEDSDPEVIDRAAELYYRFPRLVEFYRMFLRWDGEAGAGVVDDLRIAMLPELEGIFSGIIRLVFQKAVSPESGDYSDSELRSMVAELNRIYEYFHEKNGDQAPKAAASAFVMEINRRYGLVKKKDMNDYWNMIKLVRTGQSQGLVNDTNYAILPDEDASEVDRRAPSDRYGVGPYARYDPATGRPIDPSTGAPYEPFSGRTELDTEGNKAKAMLRNFRSLLDKQFADGRAAFGNTSYSLLIQQAENEIRRSASREAKLKVAFRLIQGTSVVGTDANKAFMFHETVVVGLNALSAIESMLRNYSQPLDVMNPVTLENVIMDSIYMMTMGQALDAQGSPVTGAPVAAPVANNADNVPRLLATIAARHRAYAGTGGAGAVTTFDRYVHDAASFSGRCGIPLNATLANVFAFLTAEGAAYSAAVAAGGATLGPGNLPSQFAQSVDLSKDGVAFAATPGLVQAAATERFVRVLRMCARAFVNYGRIMGDFVEQVFDLSTSSQGLVEVRFTSGAQPGIQLGFSKLRGLAEGILADVKYFLEQFRPFLSKETINRFEASTNPGSVFWLEDHLVDEIFRGKTDASPKALDGISRRTNQILQGLIRETTVQFDVLTNAGLTAAGGGPAVAARAAMIPAPAANNASRYEWYGQAFSGLLFYNAIDGANQFSSGTGIANAVAGFNDNDYSLSSSILVSRGGAAPAATGGATGRFLVYRSDQSMTPHRSLLFAFNQLVPRYLSTLTDVAGGRRIYVNLINSFANGTASQAVSLPAGNTYPDIAVAEAFGMRGDPKPGAVLFQSLAWILQRFMKDVNPSNQVPEHLVSTLTDVPLYMKEAYRANLPSFIKLFDLISQKGDFVKQLIQKVPIRLDRPDQGPLAAAANANPVAAGSKIVVANGTLRADASGEYPANALQALEVFQGPLTSDQMRSRLVAIIDAIASGAYTLSNAASEVLKELGDNPVYFQTQEGSIETYKMRYEKMPLMPLSLSLWFLSDIPRLGLAGTSDYSDQKLFPRHALGSPEFKMLYGHRQLLARSSPVSFEQVPGVKALLAAYNGVSAKREQLDEGRFLKFVQSIVAALRFVVDARNYKSMITTTDRLFSAASLIGGQNGIINYAAGAPAQGTAAYSLASPTVDAQVVLSVVENSNQDEESSKISDRVGGTVAGAARGRDMERIYNLIDMNIIPINVHALMRDIPLANLYNYEFTFEQMIASMFGEQSTRFTQAGGLADADTTSTRQMLLRLLINPYMAVTPELYGNDARSLGSNGFVHRIFRGDNNLGMGRPKFLSDQLFNKALFGSVYQARSDFDEGGPSVGIGAARGRDAHIYPIQAAARELQAIDQAITADLNAYHGLAVTGNAAGLAAAIINAAAAGAAAQAAIRDRVYDWIFNRGGLGDRIANWAARIVRLPATLPPPDPRAAVQAIANELDGSGGGAHDLVDLLGAITNLGPNKAAIIANGNFDATVDRLLAEFDRAAGGTPARLIADTLLPATANGVAATLMADINAARRLAPGATGVAAAANWGPQFGRRASYISYLKTPAADAQPDEAVVSVSLGAVSKERLQDIGKARFDTTFVRNIFFITNVVRLVRLKLNRELTQSRNVLVASHSAVAAGVTEYGSDPFGPNETLLSTYPNGQARFNDQDTY